MNFFTRRFLHILLFSIMIFAVSFVNVGGCGGGGGGGINIGGGAVAPPQVIEAAVIASVSAATDIAGTQAKAMKDTVVAQRMDARRSEIILTQMCDLLAAQPSNDDMRNIMDETGNTSGF